MTPYSVTYDESRHIIVTTLRGEVDSSTIEASRDETLRLVRQHNCLSILADLREATSAVSTLSVFQQPDRTAEVLDKSDLKYYQFRRAIVVGNVDEDARFFETVGLNRGHNVRLFRDIDEARLWLSESTDSAEE